MMGLRTRLRAYAPRRDQRGALTPAVAVMAVGLLLLGGLVTDGGRQLNAKLQATATAEEAARAGANMLDLRAADARIDEEAAQESIDAYCEQASENEPDITSCGVEDFGRDQNKESDWVSVRVTMDVPPLLFGMLVDKLSVDVTAQASPVQAIREPYEDGKLDPIDPTPEYPSLTVTLPVESGTPSTNQPVPDSYPTELCGVRTEVPLTVGLTCMITESVVTPPPPPRTTVTTTVFSTYPTNVPPYPGSQQTPSQQPPTTPTTPTTASTPTESSPTPTP